MNTAAELHERAMALYDAALLARRRGDEKSFHECVRSALVTETNAAHSFDATHGMEPTRSILYRSAATIAMTGGLFQRALELSGAGLAGSDVPHEIRTELVALIKDANYRLHVLETEGVSIGNESLIMSLEGDAVGNGMVRHDVFKAKIGAMVNLINRTIDRMKGLPFGEARAKALAAPIFVSPPIPGSFAIEVRLGDQRQPDLDGIPTAVDVDGVLNEVVECFQDFKNGNLELLQHKISSEDYYTNFMALGRTLQPDGSKITAVELIGNLRKGIKRVRITTPRSRPARSKPAGQGTGELVEIIGLLRVAEKRDEGKERVEVVDEEGKWHDIHVPAALMADVVRPLWDSRVVIQARRSGKRRVLELETIDPA